MYEKFSDRARKVMQLANQEAQRFHYEYIGPEHILLGLVKEGGGVAVNVLKNLDIDLLQIKVQVEMIVMAQPDRGVMGKLPQTPRAKKVIEYSIEEARKLNHNHVGTEHLLLGLLCEKDGVAAQVLLNLGVTIQKVREGILALVAPPKQPASSDLSYGEFSLDKDINASTSVELHLLARKEADVPSIRLTLTQHSLPAESAAFSGILLAMSLTLAELRQLLAAGMEMAHRIERNLPVPAGAQAGGMLGAWTVQVEAAAKVAEGGYCGPGLSEFAHELARKLGGEKQGEVAG